MKYQGGVSDPKYSLLLHLPASLVHSCYPALFHLLLPPVPPITAPSPSPSLCTASVNLFLKRVTLAETGQEIGGGTWRKQGRPSWLGCTAASPVSRQTQALKRERDGRGGSL